MCDIIELIRKESTYTLHLRTLVPKTRTIAPIVDKMLQSPIPPPTHIWPKEAPDNLVWSFFGAGVYGMTAGGIGL